MAKMTRQLNLMIDPELMERSKRIAEEFDEFEGQHAPVVRRAIREFVEKKERELAARDLQEAVAA